MKSPELKNILLASGVAVFAGVLVLGVNAAFGVSAPTVSPEDSGLVGPTFSEVTVNDDLTVGGDINVGTTLADPNDGTVSINASVVAAGDINGASLTSRGDVDVHGNLWDSFDGRVDVYSNLDVLSGTDANSSGAGPLRIGSDPATRMLIDNNEILSLSKLYINFGGGQDVQIGVSDFPSDVEIFGNVIIRYILTVTGITTDGVSTGDAGAEALTINDELDVWGDIKNTSSDPTKPDSDYSVSIDDKFQVSGLSTFGNDVNVIGDLNVIDGHATIPTIDGNVDINGTVTAERFGTYTTYPGNPPLRIEPGRTGNVIKSCPADQIIISCGIWTNNRANVYELQTFGNGCMGSARNNDTGPISLYVYPRCLDPDR